MPTDIPGIEDLLQNIVNSALIISLETVHQRLAEGRHVFFDVWIVSS